MATQALRRILVAADTAETAADRARFAASLATRFGAVLEGVAAALPTMPVYAPIGDPLIDLSPQVRIALERAIDTNLKRAETLFREASGVAQAEWRRSTVLNSVDFIAQASADADVLIVGRQGDGDSVDPLLGVDPADLVTTLGRPMIVLPPGIAEFSNARVVIGWKDSRESRRALADALPFLQGSTSVVLVAIADSAPAGLEAAGRFLSAHGVVHEAVVEPSHRRTDAEALLAVAERANATLIAVGAYGHSRLRQWALGGMTRSLLDRSPRPCLMSH